MTTLCIHDPCEHQNPDTADICQACGKPLRVHNQFRPVNLLGAGGFGRTFRAIASQTSLPVSSQYNIISVG